MQVTNRINRTFGLGPGGEIIAPDPTKAKTLADVKDAYAATEQLPLLKFELKTLQQKILDFAGMDGSKAPVHRNEGAPTVMKPYFMDWRPQAKARYTVQQEQLQKWEANWRAGGKDLADAPGQVISPSEENRFGMDVEMNFSGKPEFPAEGTLPETSLQSLKATFNPGNFVRESNPFSYELQVVTNLEMQRLGAKSERYVIERGCGLANALGSTNLPVSHSEIVVDRDAHTVQFNFSSNQGIVLG